MGTIIDRTPAEVVADGGLTGTFADRSWASLIDGRDAQGRIVVIEVSDSDPTLVALDPNSPDVVTVCVESSSDRTTYSTANKADCDTVGNALELTETGNNTTIFRGIVRLAGASDAAANPPELKAVEGDRITVFYRDENPAASRSDSLDVEIDGPAVSNLSPVDDFIADDDEVDTSAEVTDGASGVDEDNVFFIVSNVQCGNFDDEIEEGSEGFFDEDGNLKALDEILGGDLDCDGNGEADTVFRLDPDDIDEITDGFQIDASVGIDIDPDTGLGKVFVTVAAFDLAGNLSILDVDPDDDARVLAEYTGDTARPTLAKAFTGIRFDSEANALKTNSRAWIMVVFTESDRLNGSSVDRSDFVVESNSVVEAQWFNKDMDVDVAGEGDPWDLRNVVFLKLGTELTPDEEPDVNLVPNGVSDRAGNTRSSGQVVAEDKIGPKFEASNFNPAPSSAIVAGDNVEVSFTVTSDEPLGGSRRPTITVKDVFSPATGLNVTVRSTGTNRWSVTISEPQDTTLYNIYINGVDENNNPGDLGIPNVDANGDNVIDGFFSNGSIDTDAIYFEGDLALPAPDTRPEDGDTVTVRDPFFITLDFTAEGTEFQGDSHKRVSLTAAELDGEDVLANASVTSDGRRWLIAISGISLGEHELAFTAEDQAGNEEEFSISFEVEERAPFEVELNPGWNLISFPGALADADIADVLPSSVRVTTVYSYDPSVPGGWLVATRESLDAPWQGTLTTISANRGYWMQTDRFTTIEVDIPALVGGAAGTATPPTPPTLELVRGWNLVPVLDVTGDLSAGDTIPADIYFASIADELGRVLTFDTVGNTWVILDVDDDDVEVGKAYWVYLSDAATLVP